MLQSPARNTAAVRNIFSERVLIGRFLCRSRGCGGGIKKQEVGDGKVSEFNQSAVGYPVFRDGCSKYPEVFVFASGEVKDKTIVPFGAAAR